MLAELMQFLTEEDQRLEQQQQVRRSLAKAQRLGIGPFKRAAHTPILPPVERPKPVAATACDMAAPSFTIDSTAYGLKRGEDALHFTMTIGGLKMHMSMHKKGEHQAICSYNLHNLPDQYWAQSYTPMNNAMARHMIAKLKDAIIDPAFLQSMIEAEPQYTRIEEPIDVDTLRHYCEKALDHLEFNVPWRRIAVTGQRPTYEFPSEKKDELYGFGAHRYFKEPAHRLSYDRIGKEDIAYIDDSPANLNSPLPPAFTLYSGKYFEKILPLKEIDADLSLPSLLSQFNKAIGATARDKGEAAFEEADVTVHAIPVFNNDPECTITGKYGAFCYQADGRRYWIQFADLNGNDAADFLMIRPRQPSYPSREERCLYKEEALEAIADIRKQISAADYPWIDDVLSRLETTAKELKSDPLYLKSKGIQAYLKHFGIEDAFKTINSLEPDYFTEIRHPKFLG